MYLDKIIAHKREEITTLQPVDRVRDKKVLDVVESLKLHPFITEIKKASPSMGDINVEVDICDQAQDYARGGAGAISVLTDSNFFKGDFSYLADIAGVVDLPLLCKDFIIDEKQIENAYNCGADFILLIAAVLDEAELKRLTVYARRYGLNVLYELHSIDEFDKIKGLEVELVGVNSRNLKTFQIDKQNAMHTIGKLQGSFLKIAESGIETVLDVEQFSNAGADGFLIGTALMQSSDPVATLQHFYSVLKR